MEKRTKLFWWAVGFLLVFLFGVADSVTGYELNCSLFYLGPIALLTWFVSRRAGLVISVVSAITWLVADIVVGYTQPNPLVHLWNTAIRLGFFVITTLLLSALQDSLNTAKQLIRTDRLTGAVSLNHFFELIQGEMNRSRRYRHPFTLAYIDLDHFKEVNDQYGHHTGDEVLRLVVSHIQQQLRDTDVVARLGGDEFAILLPETNSDGARGLISKIYLSVSRELQSQGWPVTLSVGVVSYTDIPANANDLINLADGLMYSVKKSGKNGVRYFNQAA